MSCINKFFIIGLMLISNMQIYAYEAAELEALRQDLKEFFDALNIEASLKATIDEALDSMDQAVLEKIAISIDDNSLVAKTTEELKNNEDNSVPSIESFQANNLSEQEIIGQKTLSLTANDAFTPNYPKKADLGSAYSKVFAEGLWSGNPKERCFTKKVALLKVSIYILEKTAHSLETTCELLDSSNPIIGDFLLAPFIICQTALFALEQVIFSKIILDEKCEYLSKQITDAEIEAVFEDVKTLLKRSDTIANESDALLTHINKIKIQAEEAQTTIIDEFMAQASVLDARISGIGENSGSTDTGSSGSSSQLSSEMLLDLFSILDDQQQESLRLLNDLLDLERFDNP